MMGVVQGASEGDAKQALDILATVSSEKKYGDRLKELIDKAEEIKNAQANLDQTSRKADQILVTAEKMRDAMLAEGQAAKTEGLKIKAEAEQALSDVMRREVVCSERTQAADQRLLEAERSLKRRSEDLGVREAKHAEAVKAAAEKQYNDNKSLEGVLSGIEQNLLFVRAIKDGLK